MSNATQTTDEAILTPWQEFWRHFKKNRSAVIGLCVLTFFVFIALFAPWLAPFDPTQQFNTGSSLPLPPIWVEGSQSQFILGTDAVGRDMLSRLIHGARLSISIGFMVVILALALGIFIGAIAALRGGWVESLLMRLMDILLALPSLLLAIVIVAVLGPSLINAVFAVAIVYLPHYVRITRAAMKAEIAQDYVKAARLDGAKTGRLLWKTLLPNVSAPLIVQATLSFSNAILDIAALGFLGLGAQPPTPEWGTIISAQREFIENAPWSVTLPGLAILITVLASNLMGDGLRDALDPRLKR